MKKIFTTLFLALASYGVASAQSALPGLSPYTKAYLLAANKNTTQQPTEGFLYKKRNDGQICIPAIVKIKAGQAEKAQNLMRLLNVAVGTKAGTIWTLSVPIAQFEALCAAPELDYIQMDEPLQPNLDIARKTTRVDSVQAGYGLSQGFSGKGVLLGIMDFGFDYNHPTFYDTLGTKYRILKVWEMGTSGTAPTGYAYGHELSDTNLIKAQITDNAEQTHGTGVAGLSSGSGYGSPSAGKYRGVAYESEMIFVGVRRDSIGGQWLSGGFSDFIDGVHYMIDYAKSVSKPIVVNISWGSHSGPHNGTSLVNQAFDSLSGPGHIIVMSAGNDGNSNIHLAKTFSPTDTLIQTFLEFTPTPQKRTWIDIWGDSSKTFCVQTQLFSGTGTAGASTGFICIDGNTYTDTLISSNGLDTCFVQTMTNPSEYNHQPRVTVNVYNRSGDSVAISVKANSGTVNMWNEYYYYGYQYRYASYFNKMGYAWASNGDVNTTISDMGAAASTLLIGAYNSKMNFTDINGIPRKYIGSAGTYSYFTSRGPYIDGRVRPDITAPGLTIATAVNSADTNYTETGANSTTTVSKFTHPVSGKNYYFAEFSGTSASAPIASGIVALLLQINPNLDPEAIRILLRNTAIKDFYTGAIPATGSNLWGWGKINAYGAVRQLLSDMSIRKTQGTQNLDAVLFPNPNKGQFFIDFNAPQAGNYQLSAIDINGKILWQQQWQVQAGNNRKALHLNTQAAGTYWIQLKNETSSLSLQCTQY